MKGIKIKLYRVEPPAEAKKREEKKNNLFSIILDLTFYRDTDPKYYYYSKSKNLDLVFCFVENAYFVNSNG